MKQSKSDEIRHAVHDAYAQVATSFNDSAGCCGAGNSFCGSDAGTKSVEAAALELGYSQDDVSSVPEGANMGLGCGNPQAIASLQQGEVVLDLGSGGGFDCILAANQVGPSGKVVGVDMTLEMIRKARGNIEKLQLSNVEFRLGEIEHLPVADRSVDVIISNCVINLSPQKSQVFKEAYRVLHKGGRLAISDIVVTAELPDAVSNDMALYTGCMAGASTVSQLKNMLSDAGFVDVDIVPKQESREFISEWVPEKNIEDYVVSAAITASKA